MTPTKKAMEEILEIIKEYLEVGEMHELEALMKINEILLDVLMLFEFDLN